MAVDVPCVNAAEIDAQARVWKSLATSMSIFFVLLVSVVLKICKLAAFS